MKPRMEAWLGCAMYEGPVELQPPDSESVAPLATPLGGIRCDDHAHGDEAVEGAEGEEGVQAQQ